MAKQRYSSVSGDDKLNTTDSRGEDDRDTTLYRYEMEDRRVEDDDTAVSEKTDTTGSAKSKQLPSVVVPSVAQQTQEGSEDEDEQADEADSRGFHPARLHPSADTSLLHGSSLSPLSQLLSFLRLNLNRYYVVLLVALLAISCSGTLLRELPDTPPLLKAFWRLLFMSIVLSTGFVYQYRQADSALIDRFLSNDCLLAILIGGLAASAHFGFWIWSLNHTSLAHSLFFVSCYPLVTVAIMLVQRKSINWKEVVGVMLGLAGSALLLTDTSTTAVDAGSGPVVPVSVVGDIVAFLGAVVFVVYLYAGRSVRGWLPLFLYTCPMTFVSCVPLLFVSLLLEDVTFRGFTPSSIFGFLAPSSLAILCLIAALPAGLGHTGINFALHHVSPLAISVVLTLEPVLGVVVGVLAGVEVVPRWLTVLGGLGSVVGCVTAIVGTHQRETREKREAEQNERERHGNEDHEQAETELGLVVSDVATFPQSDAADNEADHDCGKESRVVEASREQQERSTVLHADKG